MNLSIYTSLFNYNPDQFDLAAAFNNWGKYANEIVIGTLPDQFRPLSLIIQQFVIDCDFQVEIIVVEADTTLEDPRFDGKIKNAALQACSNEVVIQQDMDERIGGNKEEWFSRAKYLQQMNRPVAFMVPVIDIYKDLNHYKSIGQKWYLHIKEGTNRGPVNFAIRKDGSIDTDKSDGCELISECGNLLETYGCELGLETFRNNLPHVIHLGYLDLEKRAKHNRDFWSDMWTQTNGSKVEIPLDVKSIEKHNKAEEHNLGENWWI